MNVTNFRDPHQPLLRLRGVQTSFNTPRGVLRAVDGVSIDVEEGTTLGIVGESGSGKSVLVRSIMGLLPKSAVVDEDADIIYNGTDVRSLNPVERKHFWGTEMAMIFQDPMTSLNPVKRIGRQLTEAMRFHLRLSRRSAETRALDLLYRVGIPEPRRRLNQYPHELSGGMRQRVSIAIALSCEPRLLIADEPTTALDVTVQMQILQLLDELQQEHHMTLILITHDLGVVAGHTDRMAIMYGGQIVETSSTAELFGRVRHPYTAALLASTPQIEAPSHTTLEAISGRPPDMVDPPPGCRFAPRCRYAQQECVSRVPELESTGGAHPLRCFFPVDSADGRAALARNVTAGRTPVGLELEALVVG